MVQAGVLVKSGRFGAPLVCGPGNPAFVGLKVSLTTMSKGTKM